MKRPIRRVPMRRLRAEIAATDVPSWNAAAPPPTTPPRCGCWSPPPGCRPASGFLGTSTLDANSASCTKRSRPILPPPGARRRHHSSRRYLDGGPDSAGVLARLMRPAPIAGARVVNLMGDHEQMVLEALDGDRAAATDWLHSGGGATLDSFGLDPQAPRETWAAACRRRCSASCAASRPATAPAAICSAMPASAPAWRRTVSRTRIWCACASPSCPASRIWRRRRPRPYAGRRACGAQQPHRPRHRRRLRRSPELRRAGNRQRWVLLGRDLAWDDWSGSASYPKSGNTWVPPSCTTTSARAMRPYDINRLTDLTAADTNAEGSSPFDPRPASQYAIADVQRMRRLVPPDLTALDKTLVFVQDAQCQAAGCGRAARSRGRSRRARSASCATRATWPSPTAPHLGRSIDDTIARMADPEAATGAPMPRSTSATVPGRCTSNPGRIPPTRKFACCGTRRWPRRPRRSFPS